MKQVFSQAPLPYAIKINTRVSMGYWSLLKRNPREIGFGFLNAFFSGLGQTHFVSLYSPIIMSQFALTNSEYGALYSVVTLASGLVIPFLGPFIDKSDARFFSLFIGIGLICSQLTLITGDNLILIGLALFGLRLFGQGLCSSISSITVARYFSLQRGKALSLSQTGFPIYEGLVTPLCAILLSYFSFRVLGAGLILSVLIIYIPLALSLTSKIPNFNKPPQSSATRNASEHNQYSWNRTEVFTNKTIYLLLPQVLYPPFALTGLLFHQAAIANLKGWPLTLMASGLIFFATGRIINTFVTGPLVDKYTAIKLFPFYQLPLSLGFVYLGWGNSWFVPAICFGLYGLTVGSGGPIKSAIWAELYGTQHLGALKSLFATLMVLSTAVSPALFGWALDTSLSPTPLFYTLFLCNLASALLAYIALTTHKSITKN